jgi:hypothetical protein
MSLLSPEMLNKVAEWRAKSAAGTLTLDEMREAIVIMRGNRISAAKTAASSPSSKAKKGPARSADDLLGELEGL